MKNHRTRIAQVAHNRAVVLAAAREVFLANGYAGATLDAIADRAGFTKGVVYSQFEGKADLFLALLDARIEERARENARMVAEAGDQGGFRALFGHFERTSQADSDWARLLIEFRLVAARDAELNRRYAEAHARTVKYLTELVDGICEREGLRPPVAPATIAEFILALGSGLTLERAADPASLPKPMLSTLVQAALNLPAIP
jgi:AcrR family transcriptional regulator